MSEVTFKLVVMVSGGGSNLQALIDAIDSQSLSAEIVAVIANRRDAYALERAALHQIPTHYAPLKPYLADSRGREQYDIDLAQTVAGLRPDLIVLAGWMHILSQAFLDQVGAPVINLHPALPGMFAGTHAIERAFEAFQRGEIEHSGCMIHHVIPEVDAGEVVVQAIVPIHGEDTLDTFEERMHCTEHDIIVKAVQILQAQHPNLIESD